MAFPGIHLRTIWCIRTLHCKSQKTPAVRNKRNRSYCWTDMMRMWTSFGPHPHHGWSAKVEGRRTRRARKRNATTEDFFRATNCRPEAATSTEAYVSAVAEQCVARFRRRQSHDDRKRI
uniref:(northern house mosquito) hypothetical protein n=1 Tax=Culex pipiens TaxID=7175 RepID=A0A8D8FWK9_CULPI